MKDIFGIENFNIIEDEENYYVFRALNMGDNNDLEQNITTDEQGKIERIRTDRERWEENQDNRLPKYSKDDEISLEQVFDHIKMHYRKDTNCISLSSNANVSISYGRGYYKDKYAIVKVPKEELGKKVVSAGQYMLEEIEKRVNEYILENDLEDRIKEAIEEIEKSKTEEEMTEVIKTRFKSEEILDKSKASMKKGISYISPVARISSYQALNKEQSLEKNKIIAKLTLLERVGGMKPIIPTTSRNDLLIGTIGNAYSSLELINYGDIEKESIIDVPKEIVDIFALLQQAEGEERKEANELKKELIRFVNDGKEIDTEKYKIFEKDKTQKKEISIEEMYELTEGKVEYGIANSIVKNMFYLSKSQLNARSFAQVLRDITNNNTKYEKAIEYIENNGFTIEPNIIKRQSNKGVRISESVNLDLKNNEIELLDKIKRLTDEEQLKIIQDGGLSDVGDIIKDTFGKAKKQTQIEKEEYYAEAVFSLYDWEKIEIKDISLEEKQNLLQKMKDNYCMEVYKKLEEKGIERKDIPKILYNIITREKDFEIEETDTIEDIKKKRLNQYDRLIEENNEYLQDELSIERIERFLGYYDIEGTELKLRKYQKRATEKTDEIFEEKRFASVILPTGGGKSFVALDQLMKHKDEEILYLAPQNEILEQTKDYIIKYLHGKKNTFGRSKDEIIKEVFPNIKFETYPGLLAKKAEETINKQYGFIVLDELHRTGAKEWGEKLNTLIDNQPEETKVLGITATPRRDMDGINMANEMAERLGYTNKDATSGKHVAMNMSLVNAIRMGLVVNPKLVSCAYNLKADGTIDTLREKIESIEDIDKKNEEIEKYEKLRRKLDNADGIDKILQQNVKKGGKYIVFLPMVEELEDEDGNVIGRKTGKDKIEDYEKQIGEYFKNSDIKPSFHSMLGKYRDKDNEKRLEEFQNKNTEETEFMLVLNKANEGLHIDKLDGIIWLRPLDENSKILYLQQLGRAIYSEDPDNPTPDEKRPVVIDIVNNTLKVNWNTNDVTEKDDLELLSIIVDWTNDHDGILPNINSTDKEETGYAKVLKEIQEKYLKYLDNDFEYIEEEQQKEIQEILGLGKEIDLWEAELPDKEINKKGSKTQGQSKEGLYEFQLEGLMKDFVELEDEINAEYEKGSVERFIENLEKLQKIGVDISKIPTKSRTIEELLEIQKIKKDKEEIEKLGLKLNYNIGNTKNGIIQAYRGKGRGTPPTKEQVKRLLELGIILDKIEKNTVEKFIEKLEKLQGIGVDTSKIPTSSCTIEKLLEKQKIKINKKEIEKLGLKLNDNIGNTKVRTIQTYRGTGRGTSPTKEQVERLKELGISLEKIEGNRTDKFIEKLEKLQEIGVDVSKIPTSDCTIEKLLQKQEKEIDKKEIEKLGLKLDDNIGNTKDGLGKAYRDYRDKGKSDQKPPTKEQVERLKKLGISLEERNVTDEFIEKLEKLQKIGVDVSKIPTKNCTIEELLEIQKIKIDEKEIEKLGLELNDNIGSKKVYIIRLYREENKRSSPTKEQVKRLLELGIILDKIEENTVERFIEKLEKLQRIDVDVSKLATTDTIEILLKKQKIQIDKKEIEKLGLELNDNIGTTKKNTAQAYRGIGSCTPPTKEQVERLKELGISLEKIEGNRTDKFIEKLEKLQEIGVDVSKIPTSDCTIEKLLQKQEKEIDKKEIEKLGLKLDDNIGSFRNRIGIVYREYRDKGKSRGIPPTKEQVERLKELGIRLEKIERNVTDEFIEKLEKLQEIGVDVSKIPTSDCTIEKLLQKQEKEIDKKEIEKLGLELNDNIGSTKHNITQAYRGKGTCTPPTKEQVERLKELRINLEKKEKNGKQIAQATIDSIKDIEMADEEYKVLNELAEKEKTKDDVIKKDE